MAKETNREANGRGPIIRVLIGWEDQGLGTDTARRIRGLDQAHYAGDGGGAAGAEEDQSRRSVTLSGDWFVRLHCFSLP